MTARAVDTVSDDLRGERVYDPFGAPGDLAAATVVALSALVAVASTLGPLGLRPLVPGVPGLLTLVGFVGVAAVSFTWLRRGVRRCGRPTRPATMRLVAVAFPALLLVAYLVAARRLSVGQRIEWYLGGDHVRHFIMTAGEQATGWLSYSGESYPRAWHTLQATTWSALGLRPEADVVALLDLSATLVWLLSALLTLSTASLAATWAHRSGLAPNWSAAAGAAAGFVTLTAWFLGNYQGLGLEGSLVSACTLAAVLRTQVVVPADARALVVSAAGVVVIAHSWQLLLPVVGLAALRSAVLVARRHGRAGMIGGLALAAASLGAAAPSLVAVVNDIGIDHATDADVEVPVPWVVLGLGLAAAGAFGLRGTPWARWVLALMVLPAVTGLALAGYVGITPDTYYSSKLLWHSAALLLAPLALGAAGLSSALSAAGSRAAAVLRAPAATVALIAMALAAIQPAAAFLGFWSTVDGPTVLRLLTTPGAGTAQVVRSSGDLDTDTLTRTLLDAVRPEPGVLRTPQRPVTLAEECDLLVQASTPVVLSDLAEADVRQRYRCAPDLTIVRAP